jgi:hypothetical protein
MYLLYIFPLSSTHLRLRYSISFNPSKKNSFGCAVNRKIGNRKSERLISTPTYTNLEVKYLRFYPRFPLAIIIPTLIKTAVRDIPEQAAHYHILEASSLTQHLAGHGVKLNCLHVSCYCQCNVTRMLQGYGSYPVTMIAHYANVSINILT